MEQEHPPHKNPEQTETVVSGSYRKHMEVIKGIMESLQQAGVEIRSPKSSQVTPDSGTDFVLLAHDDPQKPWYRLETDFMRDIRESDFLYVADVGGYVGESAATEIAYARLKGIPVVTSESIASFSKEVPEQVQKLLAESVGSTLPVESIERSALDTLRETLHEYKARPLSHDEELLLLGMIRHLVKSLKRKQDKDFPSYHSESPSNASG